MSMITNVRGFINLGNTCYMNSVLQALLSSNILNTTLLLFIKKNPDCLDDLSPILIEYCKLILNLSTTNTSPINLSQYDTILTCAQHPPYSPSSFKSVIDSENNWFHGHAQHDSNELLMYIINEFVDKKRNKGMTSLIKKICFGKYKQYVCCSECKNIVESKFKFLDVLLPIPDKKNNEDKLLNHSNLQNPDLEDCFKKFSRYETLSGANKWICPTCKKKVIAQKKMEICNVPIVSIFTLNRFTGTSKNNTPVKIYQYIDLEGKKLKLISTINHYGGTSGGHYVAHVSRNNIWYRADDSRITNINIEIILNDPSVYMVIYQLVS